jgi:hypothetical protein
VAEKKEVGDGFLRFSGGGGIGWHDESAQGKGEHAERQEWGKFIGN